ncbi:MAG: hypothetical protein ACXQTY_00545, partial [Candidatus Methanogasteraceae archaeon]
RRGHQRKTKFLDANYLIGIIRCLAQATTDLHPQGAFLLSHCSMRALPPSEFLTISVSDMKSSSLCGMMVMAVPCTLIVDLLSFGITTIPLFGD